MADLDDSWSFGMAILSYINISTLPLNIWFPMPHYMVDSWYWEVLIVFNVAAVNRTEIDPVFDDT